MSLKVTEDEYVTLCARTGKAPSVTLQPVQKPKHNKYRNISKEVDGYRFQSTGEANRYLDLRFQECCGLISDLRIQEE